MSVRDVPWWGSVSSAAPPVLLAAEWTIATGGTAGVLVAASPVHTGDGAPGSHILWTAVGLAALAMWPVAASRHGRPVPWALRPDVSARACVALLILLAWFGMELITSAGQAGLAERMLGEAQSAWPFVVVMSCRHPVAVTARWHAPRSPVKPGRYWTTGKRSRAATRDSSSWTGYTWPPSSSALAIISSMRSGTGSAAVPQSGHASGSAAKAPHRPHS